MKGRDIKARMVPRTLRQGVQPLVLAATGTLDNGGADLDAIALPGGLEKLPVRAGDDVKKRVALIIGRVDVGPGFEQ